jgi:hypothetical protein
MTTEQKTTTEKPIELDESDLERVTGGTGVDVVEADPCAGGRSHAR